MTRSLYQPGAEVPAATPAELMSARDISGATGYMLSHVSELPSGALASGMTVLAHAAGRLPGIPEGSDDATIKPNYTALFREQSSKRGTTPDPIVPEVAIARGIVEGLRARRAEVPRGSTRYNELSRQLNDFAEDNRHLLLN